MKYVMNNTKSVKKNQVCKKNNFLPMREITDSPEKFFSHMPGKQLALLNALISWCMRYDTVYVSQSTLAKQVGVCREYCNEVIQKFESMGIVRRISRPWRSCIYVLSSYFAHPGVRSRLGFVLTSLRSFALVALFCQQGLKARYGGESTLYTINVIRYNYITKKHPVMKTESRGMERVVVEDNPISPVLRGMKELGLTKWGQIELSIFPDAAFEYAYEIYNQQQNVRDAFRYFFRLCLHYCQINGIKPNWHIALRLRQLYKMPKEAPMTLTKHISSSPVYNKKPEKERGHTPSAVKPKIWKPDPYSSKKKPAIVLSEAMQETARYFQKLLGICTNDA